jgi:diphosphomevalonate decarboxylase
MKASAVAHPNFALVKYWGKRDESLILPFNNSIGLTADNLTCTTTVEFSRQYHQDSLIVNGNTESAQNASKFLDKAREKANIKLFAKIVSKTDFPQSSGLASSAAGYAALALAVDSALKLKLSQKELSILARHGSGSASRSVCEGFVEWHKGSLSDGTDSYAETIFSKDYWPQFRMIVCITTNEQKDIKSRPGMVQTVKTSPMYKSWLESVDKDLDLVRKSIQNRDFSVVGNIAEHNCLKMHAAMMTTIPSILYWNPITLNIIQKINEWRAKGLECYFTIDAGPQVKIICLQNSSSEIIKRCNEIQGVLDTIEIKPGECAHIIPEHLF